VFEGFFKDFACLGNHLRVFEAEHQFIIQVQAARIQVGGANINDIMNNDQFGM
jgi:hypothetical protein